MQYDIIIRNGRIVDGSGSPSFEADLGIAEDRITEIGDLSGAHALETIDANKQIVAPGFIDPHNHAHDEAEGGSPELKVSLRWDVARDGKFPYFVEAVGEESLDNARDSVRTNAAWR